MTQTEIKAKIAKLKKAIEANKSSENYNIAIIKQYEEGIKQYEAKLETTSTQPVNSTQPVKKKVSSTQPTVKKKKVSSKEKGISIKTKSDFDKLKLNEEYSYSVDEFPGYKVILTEKRPNEMRLILKKISDGTVLRLKVKGNLVFSPIATKKTTKKKVVIPKKKVSSTQSTAKKKVSTKPKAKFKVGDKVKTYYSKDGFSTSKTKDEKHTKETIGILYKVKWFEPINKYEVGATYIGSKGFWLTNEDNISLVAKSSTKTTMLSKALRTNKQTPDKLTISKGEKAESHKTSFTKDIEGAIVVLNKERYRIKEIKDRKKSSRVGRSDSYNNAKTIEKRVDAIFNSSIYDIAKTKKEKQEKKPFIDEINSVKELTTLWLNEIDAIINKGTKSDMEAIKNLMLALIKESQKNDPSDKYKSSGNLQKIIEKHNL